MIEEQKHGYKTMAKSQDGNTWGNLLAVDPEQEHRGSEKNMREIVIISQKRSSPKRNRMMEEQRGRGHERHPGHVSSENMKYFFKTE